MLYFHFKFQKKDKPCFTTTDGGGGFQNFKSLDLNTHTLNPSNKRSHFKKIAISIACSALLSSYATAGWYYKDLSNTNSQEELLTNGHFNKTSTNGQIYFKNQGSSNTLTIDQGASIMMDGTKPTEGVIYLQNRTNNNNNNLPSVVISGSVDRSTNHFIIVSTFMKDIKVTETGVIGDKSHANATIEFRSGSADQHLDYTLSLTNKGKIKRKINVISVTRDMMITNMNEISEIDYYNTRLKDNPKNSVIVNGAWDADTGVYKKGTIDKIVLRNQERDWNTGDLNCNPDNSLTCIYESNLETLENNNDSTIGSLENTDNTIINVMQNSGAITTLTNNTYATIKNLHNRGTITNFTNTGSISNFQNHGNGLPDAGLINKGKMSFTQASGELTKNITNEGNAANLSFTLNEGASFRGVLENRSNTTLKVKSEGKFLGTVKQSTPGGKIVFDNIALAAEHLDNKVKISVPHADGIEVNEMSFKADLVEALMKQYIQIKGQNGKCPDASNPACPNLTDLFVIDAAEIQNVKFGEFANGSINQPYSYGGILDIRVDPAGNLGFQFVASKTPAAKNAETTAKSTYFRSYFIDTVLSNSALNASEQYSSGGGASASGNFNLEENKDRKYFAFVLPYYSKVKYKVAKGTETSDADTKGIIGGAHTFLDSGLYGIYVGTEHTQQDDTANTNSKVSNFYAGFRYTTALKEFDAGKTLFLRTHTKAAYSRSDVNVQGGEGVGNLGAKINTYLWALNADLGVLWPVSANTSISPSVGLGYMGAYSPSTKTDVVGSNGVQGYINNYADTEHLFEATSSLKLYHKITPKVRVALEGGFNYNFNSKLDGKAALHINDDVTKESYSYSVGKLRGYAQTGIIMQIKDKLDFSVNYNGTFAKNTTAHTGFLQFNWWWN